MKIIITESQTGKLIERILDSEDITYTMKYMGRTYGAFGAEKHYDHVFFRFYFPNGDEYERKVIFVTDEELKNIREMNGDFSKAKMNLGDLELQKQSLIKYIDSIKDVFTKHEKILMEKYGDDAVINIETGEVTKKQ